MVTMEHTQENHLSNRQVEEPEEKYKNHFYTTVGGDDLVLIKEFGDSWIRKVDHDLLKEYLPDCYFWYTPGSISPTSKDSSVNSGAVDGYEIHVLTNKEKLDPWREEVKELQ